MSMPMNYTDMMNRLSCPTAARATAISLLDILDCPGELWSIGFKPFMLRKQWEVVDCAFTYLH